jgi:hypothetical protein
MSRSEGNRSHGLEATQIDEVNHLLKEALSFSVLSLENW